MAYKLQHAWSTQPSRRAANRLLANLGWLATAGLLAISGSPAVAIAGESQEAPFVVHPAAQNAASWNLRLPEEAKVYWQGEANFDALGGGSNPMLYGPGLVAALAGVVTHSLIMGGVRSHQHTKAQEEADKVLVPYQPVLADFRYAQLLQRSAELMDTRGSKSVTPHDRKAGAEWTIESEPVYSLTQDQRALVLDNTLWIYAPGEGEQKRTAFSVRVVSKPCDDANPAGFWTENAGERLKEESARMLARSLDTAVRFFSGVTPPPSSPFRTVRYRQGGTQKMERAQLITASCDTLLLKNLRGSLLLVPSTPQSRDVTLEAACAPAPSPAASAPATAAVVAAPALSVNANLPTPGPDATAPATTVAVPINPAQSPEQAGGQAPAQTPVQVPAQAPAQLSAPPPTPVAPAP